MSQSQNPKFQSLPLGTMSQDASVDRRKRTQAPISGNADGNRNGNGYANGVVEDDELRLRLRPNENHKPESYADLQLDFSPLLFSSLEQYLPFNMLNLSRELKLQYMRHILLRYSPEGERTRVQRHREYKKMIMLNYPPLHKELYTMDAAKFFVPSFLKAINDNTEESFRSIMTESSPGVYTFEMLQPHFCELLLSEVLIA
ncbi:hypothetical protein I3760_06G015200 [Carya illinoinensis]|nr:hypothetical protein I3760_06G015200 [Carya illinoinensis]